MSNHTPSTVHLHASTQNPELLEAEAFEHESKAAVLRAQAKRVRVANAGLVAPPLGERHLTPDEYAKRSRVSVATVHRWRADGMPTIPVGRRYRVDPAEADAWRREHAAKLRLKRTKSEVDDGVFDVSAALAGAGLRPVVSK